MTGIDAAEPNIAAARAHHERAGEHGDHVTYEHGTAESLKARVGAAYDVVCCLEVIEHVKSVDLLLDSLQGLVKVSQYCNVNMSLVSRTDSFTAWRCTGPLHH